MEGDPRGAPFAFAVEARESTQKTPSKGILLPHMPFARNDGALLFYTHKNPHCPSNHARLKAGCGAKMPTEPTRKKQPLVALSRKIASLRLPENHTVCGRRSCAVFFPTRAPEAPSPGRLRGILSTSSFRERTCARSSRLSGCKWKAPRGESLIATNDPATKRKPKPEKICLKNISQKKTSHLWQIYTSRVS